MGSSIGIDSTKFNYFLKKIQAGYNNVSYHNATHAADVAQTSYYFLASCDYMTKGSVSDLELTCMIVAAACHDFDHP
jgi:hypothetical protein